MTHSKTVLIVDNVDIDNSAAVLAACHPTLGLNPCAVIVTGRPANPDREAPIDKSDPVFSELVRRRNTRRLKGLLVRNGLEEVPVFEGLIPPTTLVPHRVHIDERMLDLHDDVRGAQHDGTFEDAIAFLQWVGPFDVVIGGPLTEAAALMRAPQLKGQLGIMTCQLGLFGEAVTMAGGGRTFNSAADANATAEVLFDWPGDVYMVPTDITKRPSVGFDTPDDLQNLGITEELVQLYRIFWREALQPRGERIYPHDVHPALLMSQLSGQIEEVYQWRKVVVDAVDQQGKIDVTFRETANHPKRLVVRDVDSRLFMEYLSMTLR